MLKVMALQPTHLNQPDVYVRNCRVEPLGLEYVAAALQEAGHEVVSLHPVSSVRDFTNIFRTSNFDVVCFSVYTYMLPLCYACAEAAKSIKPDVFVIFGGHHPSLVPMEVLVNEAVDVVVIGEGEETAVEVLERLDRGSDLRDVAGICYRERDCLVQNRDRERISRLDSVVFPLRSGHLLQESKNYQVMLPAPSHQTGLAQVIYSRGCFYNCRFCTSPQMWKNEVRWRSAQSVVEEVRHLKEVYNVNLFYFADLAINSDKERLMQLCEEFVKRHVEVKWWGLFSPDGIDAELLDALQKSGCIKMSVGVEGADSESFHFLKGKRSITWGHIESLFKTCWSMGFITRAFLMVGNEWDSDEYYERMTDFVRRLAIDDLRICFTVPFPGTPVYNSLCAQGKLRSQRVADYTTEVPIIVNRFNKEELKMFRATVIDALYCSDEYRTRVLKRCASKRQFIASYYEHFAFLLQNPGVPKKMRASLEDLSCRLKSLERCCSLVRSC